MRMLRAPGVVAAAAGLLALLLLLPGLGAAPFDDPGEGQHAEIAREARAGGDWLTLRLNGVRYFDKPPLLYWLVAGGFALWGRSEWAARLGPAAGAALATAGTALLGARLLGPAGGLLAGVALVSSPLFFAFGRYLRPETLFVAGIAWGFAGLLVPVSRAVPGAPRSATGGRHGERRGRTIVAGKSEACRAWSIAGCVALAAASLAKDPLGLVGPLAAVALALALAGRLRPVTAWLPPGGIAALALLGLGWYVAAAVRNPGFLWYTVMDNHFLNFLRLRAFPDEDVPLSALEFAAVAGLGAFPWIVPAALSVSGLLRRRAWRDPEETPWVALAAWAAGVLLLFTLSPFKLPHYGLPAYPALALLAARWWRERPGTARGALALHAAAFAILAVVCGLAVVDGGRTFMDAVLPATDVSTRKGAVGVGVPALPSWEKFEPLLRHVAVSFAASAVLLAPAAWSGRRRAGLLVLSATMLVTMSAVATGLNLVSSARAVAGLAAEVRRQLAPGDVLVHEGPIENSGALEYYSGRRPVLLDARRSVLGVGATLPEAAEAFWEPDRLRREWDSGRRILLVTARAPAASIVASLAPARVRLLFVANGRRLYTNASPP